MRLASVPLILIGAVACSARIGLSADSGDMMKPRHVIAEGAIPSKGTVSSQTLIALETALSDFGASLQDEDGVSRATRRFRLDYELDDRRLDGRIVGYFPMTTGGYHAIVDLETMKIVSRDAER